MTLRSIFGLSSRAAVRGTLQYLFVVLSTLAWQVSLSRAQTSDAATDSVSIESVKIGFSGHYQLGKWTPLLVKVQAAQATTGQIEVVVPDSDGIATSIRWPAAGAISIDEGETLPVPAFAKIGRSNANLHIRFVSEDDSVLAERSFSTSDDVTRSSEEYDRAIPTGLPATDRLVLTLGPRFGVEAALASRQSAETAFSVVHLENADALPENWLGWDGVAMVALAGLTDDSGGEASLTLQQRRAMQQWIEQGGQLLLAIGKAAPQLLADDEPIADFVPGRFVGVEQLRQARPLEEFCDSEFPLRVSLARNPLPVAKLTNVQGNVLLAAGRGELPLVVESLSGLGRVVMVATDFHTAPLADWSGRSTFLAKLVQWEEQSPIDLGEAKQLTSLGYQDLSGQLRAALDIFPNTKTISFLAVLGLALLYLLLLGPGDFWLTHKLGKRPWLTWWTLPLLVVVCAGTAWWMSHRLKSGSVMLHRVEIVDIDQETGVERGMTWAQLYSPQHERFDLELQLPESQTETSAELSWHGLSGNGIGGMTSQGEDMFFARGYEYAAGGQRLQSLPIAAHSTKALYGHWVGAATKDVSAELQINRDGVLVGLVTNQNPTAFINCRLFHDRWMYPVGDIQPEQSIDLSRIPPPQSLQNILTKKQVLRAYGDQRHDPSSRDIEQIVTMMMWHDLAGGNAFTRLRNQYFGELDLSPAISRSRAVLVAELESPESEMLVDEQELDSREISHNWVRFVITIQDDQNEENSFD